MIQKTDNNNSILLKQRCKCRGLYHHILTPFLNKLINTIVLEWNSFFTAAAVLGIGFKHPSKTDEKSCQKSEYIFAGFDFTMQCPPLNGITDNRINRLL